MEAYLGVIKCQKCRKILQDETRYSLHIKCDPQKCNSYNLRNIIYIDEDRLPDWIKVKVEEEEWTKGKLHCLNCGCKVGSFDFISGRKCDCGSSIIPPVHFIGSQVDRSMELEINFS